MTSFLLQSAFDWKQLLLGSESWSFLGETVLRSLIMFTIIVVSLRLLGKRGIKQLSVFELVVIIGLGSAAGDPMFYKEVGILPAVIVFFMVISLYKLIMFLIGRSKGFERLVEGRSVCLIADGRFTIENFKKETLAQDEFFAELRIAGVMHLGQIELAIIEVNGSISLFYYEDEKVKHGLPILPELFKNKSDTIPSKGQYSCTFCGFTEESAPVKEICPVCSRKTWVESIDKRRVR